MDLKLPKMLCKDSKQHHVMFHELNSVSSLLCIAQNVRFEIPYKDLYFETPFLMTFKYYAWTSYADTSSSAIMNSAIANNEYYHSRCFIRRFNWPRDHYVAANNCLRIIICSCALRCEVVLLRIILLARS